MRTLALPALLLACLSPGAAAVTEQDCRDHRAQVVRSLERSRDHSLRELGAARERAAGAAERARLSHQMEQAWDHEERMRAMGEQIWRDCMAHVRAVGAQD